MMTLIIHNSTKADSFTTFKEDFFLKFIHYKY